VCLQAKWGSISQYCPPYAKFSEPGVIPFLKWAISEGDTINDRADLKAEEGSLEAVKWLLNEGEWREQIIYGAAIN
jgi:hypothetical protein